ncbi:MAG: hypothetical protein IT566_06965 [Rhodospirillaceae bacterium]|nr:hypothetical protein [Rhodospirillaceae bacterium]
MRHEKNLPAAPTSPFTHAGVNAPTPITVTPDTVDVCAEMFKFCKQCDEKYLRPRKIQCLFDVDSGAMNRGALQLVCEVIETLLADISQSGVCHASAASLTVTLRRRHGVWILAVTERHITSLRRTATVRRLSLVRRRARLLGAACRVHETNEGFITALMFDSTAATSGWRRQPSSEALH